MLGGIKRWFRRNQTLIAVGVGVVGAGYVVKEFVVAKLKQVQERNRLLRMQDENLKRRFYQNQEDCTFTVLALLPTVTANILEAMNTEAITYQIQQMKSTTTRQQSATTTSPASGAAAPSAAAGSSSPARSVADTVASTTTNTDDDGRSVASTTDTGIHASQVTMPSSSGSPSSGVGTKEGSTSAGASVTVPAQKPSAPGKTKRQLWDDLTISSLTRTFTLIYTLALLLMLTRIQLNLLGRRTYLSSVIAQATAAQQSPIHLENRDDAGSGGAGQPQSGSMLFENADELANQPSVGAELETNRRYLTFVWWLMNRGWQPLRDRVEAAVRDVFGKLSPRDALTFDQFSSMVQKVRQKVESGPHPMATYQGATSSSRWLEFMLPPRELEHWVLVSARIVDDSADETAGRHETEDPTLQSHVSDPSSSSVSSPLLRRLLDETADLIDSPAFAHVTAQVLDAGFALLLDRKVGTGAFEFPPVDEEEQRPLSSMSTSMTASSTAALPRPAVVGSDTAATDAAATKAIPLARILPVVARQARVVGSGCGPGDPVAESGLGFSSLEPSSMMLNGHAMPQFQAAAAVPNEYLHAMDSVPGVTAFSAVVYSSNWENEIADDDWWSAPAENDRGAPKVDMGQGRAEQQERQQQLQQSQPRKPEASASASAADFESIWQQSTVRTL